MPKQGTTSIPARLRALDRAQRHAVLATSSATGPHASLVAFVLTKDGKGIVFATSAATTKFRNMKRDARVSLLIDSRMNSSQDYQEAEAMTVFGKAQEVQKGPRRTELARVLVGKHPELASFVAAPSTALIRVAIKRCVHVRRFQEVTTASMRARA